MDYQEPMDTEYIAFKITNDQVIITDVNTTFFGDKIYDLSQCLKKDIIYHCDYKSCSKATARMLRVSGFIIKDNHWTYEYRYNMIYLNIFAAGLVCSLIVLSIESK